MVKKGIFKRPGIFIQEPHTSEWFDDDFVVYCKECLHRQYNTYEETQYCLECLETTDIINKEERRDIKIKRLLR